MLDLFKAMLWSPVFFMLPWLDSFKRKRRLQGLIFFAIWFVGYLCAIFIWFGVGVLVVVLSGLCAVVLADLASFRNGLTDFDSSTALERRGQEKRLIS